MNYLEYSNQGPEIAIYTIFGLSALLIRSIWSQVETGSIFLNNKNSMSSKTLLSFIFDNNNGGVALSTDSVMVCDTRYDNCWFCLNLVCAKLSQIIGYS